MIVEEFGLSTKCYRKETMTYTPTLLWKLCKKKEQREEVKNELNLFYVALTRAKYALHITLSEKPACCNVRYAKNYAQFIDFSVWERYLEQDAPFDLPKAERHAYASGGDPLLKEAIVRELTREYPFAGGENLPVKRSASAVMRELDVEQSVPVFAHESVDEGHGKTDIDSGIAYHAFLQYFDFYGYFTSDDKTAFLEESLLALRARAVLSEERFSLLDKNALVKILENPVFLEIAETTLYREREFIAALSVADIYGAERYPNCADEQLVFQGAIDLMSFGTNGSVRIVDYKYSVKNEQELLKKYALQLELYRKATAVILKIPREKIRCSIVNLFRGFQVDVE